MNSCNTYIFFSNYYHLQSVRFELALSYFIDSSDLINFLVYVRDPLDGYSGNQMSVYKNQNLYLIKLVSHLAPKLTITQLEVMIFHATSFPGSFLTVNDGRENLDFCLPPI